MSASPISDVLCKGSGGVSRSRVKMVTRRLPLPNLPFSFPLWSHKKTERDSHYTLGEILRTRTVLRDPGPEVLRENTKVDIDGQRTLTMRYLTEW